MKLNETISKARKRKGLTQEQLAQKLYVTRQAVSR
ncbi:MAG: helix-turn-helix transcriptional regulator, partial [Eggerthellaceae bacterium]